MQNLANRLDDLAHAVATPTDDPNRPCAVAAVVADLECLAGLPAADGEDSPMVLARRFARVHRRLLAAEDLPSDAGARLDRHLMILQDPVRALLSAWNDWQDLRTADAPFDRRLAARDVVAMARTAVCRPSA